MPIHPRRFPQDNVWIPQGRTPTRKGDGMHQLDGRRRVDPQQDWRGQGSCASSDPNLWFSPGAIEHREAKKICRECPVRLECLSYAMDAPVDHGVWGGMTERERRRHRRTAGALGWRNTVLSSN